MPQLKHSEILVYKMTTATHRGVLCVEASGFHVRPTTEYLDECLPQAL